VIVTKDKCRFSLKFLQICRGHQLYYGIFASQGWGLCIFLIIKSDGSICRIPTSVGSSYRTRGYAINYIIFRKASTIFNLPLSTLLLLPFWKQHPDVLLLDCTYKITRFSMPLLNICAITGGSGLTTFIRQEREVDYNWS
jgi:hypothetical protein